MKNSLFFRKISYKMDSLFNEQSKRLNSEQEERDLVVAKKLIETYNSCIKESILELYGTKGPQISRLIEIAKTLPECPNLETLDRLKKEYAALNSECSEYCGQILKDSRFRIFYNWNNRRDREFPPWEVNAAQYWCDYWQSGMLLGGSRRYEKHNWSEPYSKTPQVVQHYTEWKSREIHVDIWKTVTTCTAWQQRYGLEHLDTLAFYVPKK